MSKTQYSALSIYEGCSQPYILFSAYVITNWAQPNYCFWQNKFYKFVALNNLYKKENSEKYKFCVQSSYLLVRFFKKWLLFGCTDILRFISKQSVLSNNTQNTTLCNKKVITVEYGLSRK